MQINLTQRLIEKYPDSLFGNLIIRDIPNKKMSESLEKCKRILEREIRDTFAETDKDDIIQNYNRYFRLWNKTYPIEYQIISLKSGKQFPQVSVLVDCMFLAELKNRILTSGHNLEEIKGDLTFDVSIGGEQYLKINGKEQILKENDIILKDNEGILASILYGPARRTTISLKTKSALYFAWCPYKMDEQIIEKHLADISLHLRGIFGIFQSEMQFTRP